MRLARCLVPSLALAALCAADAAPPVVLTVADGAKLAKDWDASIYAKVWNDPAAAKLREAWGKAMADVKAENGVDPLEVLLAAKGFRLAFVSMTEIEKPVFQGSVDLGALAAPILAKLKEKITPALVPLQVAGSDEAFTAPGEQGGRIARFGTTLAFSSFAPPAKPDAAAASPADLAVDVDLTKLVEVIRAALPKEKLADFDKAVANAKQYIGTWTYRGDLVPEGIRERIAGSKSIPAVLPVDRALLARLPATTLMVAAVGFDGKQTWANQKDDLLVALDGVMHQGSTVGSEQTLAEVNAVLQGIGLKSDLAAVVQGLSGTFSLAISQGAPFPGITIALPRSPATDELIGLGMQQLQAQPPAEGQSALVPIPNMALPVSISLICDAKYWVLTSDAVLAGAFTSGQPGGFADSPAGKQLYAVAPANACILGASDTPSVLRTIHSYLGMVLGMNADMPVDEKQAILGAIQRLSGMASTGYLFAASDAVKGTQIETRGIIGLGVIPLIGAAAGFANQHGGDVGMHEHGGGANEAVIELLAGQVFPAQIQYQGSAFSDADGDHIGEYGTLAELQAKELLAKDLDKGWQLAVFLPDGKGGAIATGHGDKSAADAQEKSFVVYAWPAAENKAAQQFAVDQSGIVYEAPYTGEAPAWNVLYGGQKWDSVPAWQPAQH